MGTTYFGFDCSCKSELSDKGTIGIGNKEMQAET